MIRAEIAANSPNLPAPAIVQPTFKNRHGLDNSLRIKLIVV
jgi:hypothetical protein